LGFPAQAFAIVGFGRSSGKTTVIQALIKELRARGYAVATIKHIQGHFDVAEKDTELHARAGALSVTAVSPKGIAIMRYDISPNLENALKTVSPKASFILVEGFRHSELPKILCLSNRKVPEKEEIGGNILAVIDAFGNSPIPESLGSIPIFRMEDIPKLADLLERNSLESISKSLPGLNCGHCGFKNCEGMAKAILRGEASISQCEPLSHQEAILEIEGESIPMVPFVQKILKRTVLGFVTSLKGVGKLEGRDPSELRLTLKIEALEEH
jgi:molybdopterin-guanine dinucleotide biosynthesis protein B